MSSWNQLYFPDANSEMAVRLFHYHDLVMVVMVMVLVLVLSFMVLFLFSGFFLGESSHLNVTKNEPLELFWSIAPFCVLIVLGFISLKNLYDMEVGENVKFTLKVTGHQWYWEYRYELDLSEVNNKDEFKVYTLENSPFLNVSFSEKDLPYAEENLVNKLSESSEFIDNNLSELNFFLEEVEFIQTKLFNFVKNNSISVVDKVGIDMDLCLDLCFKIFVEKFSPENIKNMNLVIEDQNFLDELNKCFFSDDFMKFFSGYLDSEESDFSDFKEGSLLVEMDSVDDYLDGMIDYIYVGGKSSVLNGICGLYLKGEWFYSYDSYLVPEEYLKSSPVSMNSGFRNQDVGIPCFLVRGEKNEILVSTADVFHSWGVTELGVKADAVPGRVNALKVVPLHSGMAYGFCYELCGAGHSQMPIVVLVANLDSINWVIKSGILAGEEASDFICSLV
uniref:Cytochrome c oxidase subunit 2 n=1 Tax=Cyclina sinensis TaxID=120566 RepID=A0A125S9T7_CYCSN|nr:cytochrome c oxidase subunit II [Cyclina sinensis]